MKIFLGVLVILLALLAVGCGTKTIVVMSPAPQATVTVTPSPLATEAQAGLNDAEQRTYEFIAVNYPKLRSLNERAFTTLDSDSTSTRKAISTLVSCGQPFLAMNKRWNRVDWAYGAVGNLEDDFDHYVDATRRYYKNWVDALTGGNLGTCAQNAINARDRMDKYGPRVEAGLSEVEGSTGGY